MTNKVFIKMPMYLTRGYLIKKSDYRPIKVFNSYYFWDGIFKSLNHLMRYPLLGRIKQT